MHTNFEKRKVPQAVGGNFAQKWLSVRHMFRTIRVPLSVAKVLGKHVRSSSYLVLVFFKENSLKTVISIIITFEPIFSRTLSGDRKINKIYQPKLKSGNELWALEIVHYKLRLYGKLFCIRQTLQLLQFYRVSVADLCVLLINTFENLPLINSEANLRPPLNECR